MKGLCPQWFPVHDLPVRTWGRECIIAHTKHYLGKVLDMKAGTRGALQYHRQKHETFFLFLGRAKVTHDDGTGHLTEHLMEAGESCQVEPGVAHQVEALDNCIFFEVSTPHFEDRVNVARAYGRQRHIGDLPSTRQPKKVKPPCPSLR